MTIQNFRLLTIMREKQLKILLEQITWCLKNAWKNDYDHWPVRSAVVTSSLLELRSFATHSCIIRTDNISSLYSSPINLNYVSVSLELYNKKHYQLINSLKGVEIFLEHNPKIMQKAFINCIQYSLNCPQTKSITYRLPSAKRQTNYATTVCSITPFCAYISTVRTHYGLLKLNFPPDISEGSASGLHLVMLVKGLEQHKVK